MLCALPDEGSGAERTIVVNKKYLNIPISGSEPRHTLHMSVKGLDELAVQVRIAQGELDYWVYKDMTRYKGKRIVLSYDGPKEALDRVFLADTTYGQAELYREALRPQYHYTARRGWINDPNGLVWHNGKYHLYYQHNPYERDWENMHWGHAVSADLVHWQEMDDVLFPDSLGTMFSGSAVFDEQNTSGFGNSNNPPLVFAYTAAGKYQTQCIAYSVDSGESLIKYDNNPVIDSHDRWKSLDTRDPRLFWYAPKGHWVMVLFERDGNSIYTSTDLKNWIWRSHVRGFWECPDLFELPVDGDPSKTMWVMYGASGTYVLGDFDGYTFTPRSGKQRYCTGTIYASQTFNNVPDGRRIQIGWGRIDFPDMPFNGQMLLPTELSLRTTRDGLKLVSFPVREVLSLLKRQFSSDVELSLAQANEALARFNGCDGLHIRCTIGLSYALSAGLDLNGQHLIDYNASHDMLNGYSYFPQDPCALELKADIYIDRSSVEVFAEDGLFSLSFRRENSEINSGLSFWGGEISIRQLEIDTVDSIWPQR